MGFAWDKLKANLKKLQNGGVEKIAQDLISKNENEVTELNTDKQLLDKGINSDGTDVEPAYTKTTISIKKRKGQPTNRVTLKDTGSFHRDFFVDTKKKGFSIGSKNSKTNDLVDKYGKKIFGLTNKSKSSLSYSLRIDLVKQIKRKL
jgi:hypothetical protein